MTSQNVLVLGTTNRDKSAELVKLLNPLPATIKTLADFPDLLEVDETGQSFAENAALKASAQAKHLSQWVLGEDSGLVVDALDGAPGIISARWSGAEATTESNNHMLLEQLADTPLERRTAHYVCSMAVADAAGNICATSEARCHGRIRFQPIGSAGFGYDPLFEIVEYHRTFGELGVVVKSAISHRARAAAALLPQLQALFRLAAYD